MHVAALRKVRADSFREIEQNIFSNSSPRNSCSIDSIKFSSQPCLLSYVIMTTSAKSEQNSCEHVNDRAKESIVPPCNYEDPRIPRFDQDTRHFHNISASDILSTVRATPYATASDDIHNSIRGEEVLILNLGKVACVLNHQITHQHALLYTTFEAHKFSN